MGRGSPHVSQCSVPPSCPTMRAFRKEEGPIIRQGSAYKSDWLHGRHQAPQCTYMQASRKERRGNSREIWSSLRVATFNKFRSTLLLILCFYCLLPFSPRPTGGGHRYTKLDTLYPHASISITSWCLCFSYLHTRQLASQAADRGIFPLPPPHKYNFNFRRGASSKMFVYCRQEELPMIQTLGSDRMDWIMQFKSRKINTK